MSTPGKILVIKPSSLGDVAHVFPALEILHRSFPDSELDFVIHPAFADLLDLSPFPVRKKILFDRKKLSGISTFLPELCRLIKEIRAEQYTMAVDFQGLFRSSFMTWISQSCLTAGFSSPREKIASIFYSRKISVDMNKHAVERYVELANKLCGTDFGVPAIKLPELKLPASLENLLPEKFVVLVPGARWPSKVFPAEFFARTIKSVQRLMPEVTAVITGSASDRELAAAIRETVPDAVDLTGKTSLVQLAAVMKRAEAVLTNDSGPMHIAALTGSRIFALFGPTSPELTGPYGDGNHILRAEAPCLNCMKRLCPGKEKYLCHRIDPEETGEAICSCMQNTI